MMQTQTLIKRLYDVFAAAGIAIVAAGYVYAETSLSGRLDIENTLIYAGSSGLGTARETYSNIELTFTSGTSTNQANRVFTTRATIATNAAAEYDLYGVLTDRFGDTISLQYLRGIVLKTASANNSNVYFGGASSAGTMDIFGTTNDYIKLPPNSRFLWVAPAAGGWIVSNEVSDTIRLYNASETRSATVDVYIIGAQ